MAEILGRLRAALAASYHVERELRPGGMATVFLAQDLRHHRPVAVKVLKPEIAALLGPERFLHEIEIAGGLQHPNILTVLDSGAAGGMLYYVMPYVEGESLRERLERDHQLPIDEALRLTGEVADALDSAHRHGIVHRDIKPENILLSEGHAMVSDFGIARAAQNVSSQTTVPVTGRPAGAHVRTPPGIQLGTPSYMSPEQAAGNSEVDGRSDTYSLACVLFEMLAGQPLFAGTRDSVIHQQISVEPRRVTTLRPAVPEPVSRVLHRALAKTPADRYGATGEFATTLVAAWRGQPRPVPIRRPVMIVAALATAAVLAWAVWPRPPARSLAVLPFTNVTGDAGLDYVCDGVAAETLAMLVQETGLNVASRTSTWSLRGSQKDATRIARELGVRNIVEGTVQRRADGLKLGVQLVDGRDGFVLWSGEFLRRPDDLPRLAGEISAQIAARLAGRAVASAAAGSLPTRSGAAYDDYLQASRLLEAPDVPQGPARAVALFERAIAADPTFALAHAGLSRALWRQYRTSKDPATLRRAQTESDRAIELRPELLEARLARAQMFRALGRFDEAIAELNRILEANPNWDDAHLHLAACYREAGNPALAEESIRRALALRPGYWNNWNSLGAHLVRKGDYAGARAAFEHIVELLPDENRGYEQLAAVATLTSRFEDAIAAYERLPRPVEDGILESNIGIAYFMARRLPEAERHFQRAVELEPRDARRWQNLGELHLRQGRRDLAQEEYSRGLGLAEEQLALRPQDLDLGLLHVLLLAKTGRCERAMHELTALRPRLQVADPQVANNVARTYALCGHLAEALEALRAAIGRGFSVRMVRETDDYHALAGNPEFQRLTRGAGGD